jgi:hypothetical protein
MKLHVNSSVRLELEELRQRLQEAEETLDAFAMGKSMRSWCLDRRVKRSSPWKVRNIPIVF